MTKQEWKTVHRLMRVIKRETLKAAMDAMLYGTGIILIPEDGSDPKRIHPKDTILRSNS